MAEKSRDTFEHFNERATLWLARCGSVGLAIMMFLTLFDVIGRAFDHPITGSVEVTELIMGLMIYLGVGYTTFLRGHIRVDILITNFSPRIQAVLDSLTGIVALAITILISWYLFRLASGLLANNDTTQIWEIDLWPFGFVMAAASILMVTAIIFHILISLRVATGRRDPSNYVKSLAPGK